MITVTYGCWVVVTVRMLQQNFDDSFSMPLAQLCHLKPFATVSTRLTSVQDICEDSLRSTHVILAFGAVERGTIENCLCKVDCVSTASVERSWKCCTPAHVFIKRGGVHYVGRHHQWSPDDCYSHLGNIHLCALSGYHFPAFLLHSTTSTTEDSFYKLMTRVLILSESWGLILEDRCHSYGLACIFSSHKPLWAYSGICSNGVYNIVVDTHQPLSMSSERLLWRNGTE